MPWSSRGRPAPLAIRISSPCAQRPSWTSAIPRPRSRPTLPQPTPKNLRKYRGRFLLFALALLLGLFLQEEGLLISALVYLGIGLGRTLGWVIRVATHEPGGGGASDESEAAVESIAGAESRRAPTVSRHVRP